jgi:hypothetical protein
LCGFDQLKRINALVDCVAHEHRHEVVRHGVHTLQIDPFNVHLSVDGLASLVETELNACLHPTLKLHTVAHQIVATTKRERSGDLSVVKLNFGFDVAAFRRQRDCVGTALESNALYEGRVCRRP